MIKLNVFVHPVTEGLENGFWTTNRCVTRRQGFSFGMQQLQLSNE